MWTYRQTTGELLAPDGTRAGGGYSGFGEGKNNPAYERTRDVGPIPKGKWKIGLPYDTALHGPHVMALMPLPETVTHGRSGFLIHGDSIATPGTASHGCVILSRALRSRISTSGDTLLAVTV